jgi:uncharacterized protein (TIGR00290 family)
VKTYLSWSSGKDSAWSLHVLRQTPGVDVAGLFTTINAAFDRVAMHGVRRDVLETQAAATGLPLHVLEIPFPCSNEAYGEVMGRFVEEAKCGGVEAMAFGDLFLEDIRHYRMQRLAGTGIDSLFPLWGSDTARLARDMIAGGLEAHLTCIDPNKLDRVFAGRRFDDVLLTELPQGIDPCGENGEFHTCVVAGPMFSRRIEVVPGDIVERDGFVFADLVHSPRPSAGNM